MKQLTFLVVVLIILVGGGLLTSQFSTSDASLLPVIKQTDNPSGSVSEVVPWKAEQFFLLVGFVLVNMIGIGATLALIFWVLDRGVKNAKATTSSSVAPPKATATVIEET
ncbi:MAG: hypothetical protein H7Y09_12015 [Chitinophagaceae bacterium]|nr:hypothetical protein [Anaerolineae bacterium]